MEHIQRFISESKKLMDYALCMAMATGYKVGKVDSANYSRLLQAAEKEMRDLNMETKNEILDSIVNAYFEHPKKTLEEIFEEYTIDFTQEQTDQFFENLKAIIN